MKGPGQREYRKEILPVNGIILEPGVQDLEVY